MNIPITKLRDFLLDIEIVNKDSWEKIFQETKGNQEKIEQILIKNNLITEDGLIQIKGHIIGVPFIDLEKLIIEQDILNLIPKKIAQNYQMIAYRKSDESIEVAMLDPDNLQEIDFIKKKTNLNILPRLTNQKSLNHCLKQYEKSLKEQWGNVLYQNTNKEPEDNLEIKKTDFSQSKIKISQTKKEIQDEDTQDNLKEKASELPVIKIVESILEHSVNQSASDIHIEPLEKKVIVRYRIDGILHDVMDLPQEIYSGVIARIKVISNLKLDEHRLPQDGRFKIESTNYKVSFRVSILPVKNGEKVVMRLLKEGVKNLTLESLGLYGKNLKIVQKNIERPHGMILVTGPTGSGKTTTLYSMMEMLNKPQVNISTIEDPIEYQMPRINQTQVNTIIGLTFSNGLRALVRQDPDIIMVGEIRDTETASLAINAALTGHLVLSTLHTNSASGAFPRLIDMKTQAFLLSSTANLVMAQRLVRVLCESKEEYILTESDIKSLSKEYNMERILLVLKDKKIVPKNTTWEKIKFYKPNPIEGCAEGYKGRIGIFEILEITEAIKILIEKEVSSDVIQNKAIEEGMTTMLEDGFIKAIQGITSLEEVLRVTKE